MKILITGGLGFIGSALIRHLLNETKHEVINVDNMTYSASISSLNKFTNKNYIFYKEDICKTKKIKRIFQKHKPDVVMHLAAESHVDRSIESSEVFIKTNIFGTYSLLEVSRKYFESLDRKRKKIFKFHHISTDEVYGDLENTKSLFTEKTRYDPSSPYSASKASSDHLVRAWSRTYQLPILITNCSNNYGPFHFPEKFIPHTIINALKGKNIPIYGDGMQIRDWLYVDDHIKALLKVLSAGSIGSTYNIGGFNEISNLDVAKKICLYLDKLVKEKPANVNKFSDLIEFVKDRPGHDKRYAIDATKIYQELNWEPIESFDSGLLKTVKWYIDNKEWWTKLLNENYKLERLGTLDE